MTMMKEIGFADADATPRPTIDARRLTDSEGLAHIRLDEKLYTLRITKAGKLILTK